MTKVLRCRWSVHKPFSSCVMCVCFQQIQSRHGCQSWARARCVKNGLRPPVLRAPGRCGLWSVKSQTVRECVFPKHSHFSRQINLNKPMEKEYLKSANENRVLIKLIYLHLLPINIVAMQTYHQEGAFVNKRVSVIHLKMCVCGTRVTWQVWVGYMFWQVN